MRFSFTFLFCIFYSCLHAQFVSPRKVVQMHDTVFESSGLWALSPNRIYTHNDSGDLPRFFLIDTLGNILRTIYLSQATATDFEDITRDASGNIYIGDFGNNFNIRTDLKIYKTGNPQAFSNDTLAVEIISFNYSDQTSFPPDADQMNFDCEGFFWFNDSLYLFSKNRGVSEYAHMYRLPAQPGTYTAQLVDSFYTGKWITSAAINPSANAIALLGNGQIRLYTGFSGSSFTQSTAIHLQMDSTQKEAITFINDTAVYISDERFLGIGGNLYYLSLGEWIPSTALQEEFSVQVFNNPSTASEVILSLSGSASYQIEIYDRSGKMIENKTIGGGNRMYKFSRKQAGLLFARVTSREGKVVAKTVMIF